MPSSLLNVLLIARREYMERIRARSFAIMTILIPLLMSAVLYGSYLVNRNGGSLKHIAVVTEDTRFAADLQSELSDRGANKVLVDTVSPGSTDVRERLDAQLKDKKSALDGYLTVKPAVAGHGRPTFEWSPRAKADIVGRGALASAIRATLTRERLLGAGMPAPEVEALMKPVDLDRPGDTSGGSGAAFGSAYGMFFLMYFIILFYGMNVARSIIEEKTSRVFEVLLATIKPSELMAGKVIGVGSVGLTQVGIWLVVALAVVKLQLAGSGVQLLPSGTQIIFFVVFFLLGYLLYSSVAAALGAMTSSEQELQQMNIFLMLPLITCSVIIFRVVTDSDGTLARVFSYIPFCAPLIMYTRIIVHQPPAIEIAVSLALLIATIALVLWVASRIYRVGILMYGKKPNLPEIIRWLR